MKVKDMMHKGVACVSPDTAIDAVAKKMRALDVGAIPVASDGALVGMIHRSRHHRPLRRRQRDHVEDHGQGRNDIRRGLLPRQ
jgi:predicted transcriptional regulator